MNANFAPINDFIDSWSTQTGIQYLTVCDESDVHGVMLFQKNRDISDLMKAIRPTLEQHKYHVESKKVRGGVVLAFSMQAISEDDLTSIIDLIAEEYPIQDIDQFTDKVDRAFQTAAPLVSTDFSITARKIVETAQPKPRYAKSIVTDHNFHPKKNVKFMSQLQEALAGMATQTGAQPGDLFQKFAQALTVLGQQMGIGPLQDQLKKQGINWKKSDDGQAVILFVQNAQTNAPQPIARISAETLEKPNEFEQQLLAMIDFSRGQAPGAFKQQQDEIRAQEQAVREISKAMAPADPNSATSQLQAQGQAPAQPQAIGPAAQPAQPTAVQQAGLPKKMGTPAVGSLPRRSA